jgi:hypothetical protein
LLIAVEKAKLTTLIADLDDRGVPAAAPVGEILEF